MPNITKCDNSLCPLKESCYRWTSPPKPQGQSWFTGPGLRGGDCTFYWPTGAPSENNTPKQV